jgi:SAM-dependent methyltransferase
MYDRNTFRTLLAPEGRAALGAAEQVTGDLAGLTALRARYPADLAALAHLTVQLRRRAAPKFSRAADMYFLPEALEQATGETVARHKAARFAGRSRVLDLGCGIGGDLIALAEVAPAVGIDVDGLRLAMAGQNARAYDAARRCGLVQADITALHLPADAFHWDPSRRSGGRRQRAGERFLPPLSRLPGLLERIPDGAVCVGPATPDAEIPGQDDGELEAISVRGECKALVLWCGAFRTTRRRATRLPEGLSLTSGGSEAPPITPAPRGWVLVPDPAVVRAHLVRELAHRLEASLLDPHIALLTADRPPDSAWTRGFEVIASFPFARRRLRRELAARGLEPVTFSQHGVALGERELAALGRCSGTPRARVFLVRMERGVSAIITESAPSSGEAATSP